MTTEQAENRRQEMCQDISRRLQLTSQMERLGVAWKPEFEKPFPYLKPMVSCIASHQDNVLLIEGGNSRGRVNRDWFDERAPREDGLTDEADLDVTMLMLRDVRMGLLVSQRASLVNENVIACLQIVDDVRDHAHTITDQEHCHSEAFLILGFAYEIPFRLLLIFHPDSRSSLDRISASVKYLETMHSEIDKQDFKSLETGRKQRHVHFEFLVTFKQRGNLVGLLIDSSPIMLSVSG
jgi:hypothetical protein